MSEAKRDVLAEFEAMIAAMGPEEKAELDKLLEPELSKPWLPVPGPQSDAYYSKADILLYGGAAGGGKMLSLDTPIPTPAGWTEMGLISPGDTVFDESGHTCSVLAISAIQESTSYRLTFDDGSEIVACAEHQWLTYDAAELAALTRKDPEWRAARRAKRPSRALGNKSAAFMAAIAKGNATRVATTPPPSGTVRTTREIVDSLLTKAGRRNHAIPVAGAIACAEADLLVPPYVLGAWLGDGSRGSGGLTGIDPEIWREFERAGYEVTHAKRDNKHHHIKGLIQHLRRIGVADRKHVPAIYLRGSEEQRTALLQGLMDTDGHAALDGACEFDNTNKRLIDAVYELVVSLGMRASVTEGRATLYGKDCGPRWRVKFMANRRVFRLERKAARQREVLRRTNRFRYIVDAIEVDPVPMRCIAVDSPSHLYLAGRSFIPTHNSSLLVGVAMTEHSNSVIYRRAYADISGLEEEMEKINRGRAGYNSTTTTWRRGARRMKFEALEKPKAEESAQGKATTYIGLDEGAQLTVTKVRFVMGWLRPSKDANERCRMIIASNPPMGGEGEWMMEWFAPWLEPTFANPAEPGELRWAYFKNEDTVWVDGPGVTVVDGEEYTHMSRTFIPSKVDDNPYLKDTGYKGRIQNLPEPMRSKLLYGDFLAGRQDHEWQVIPSAWVTEANNRWRRADPHKRRRMLALAADIALGGADNLVMSRLHEDNWFAPLEVRPGSDFGGPTGSDLIASLLLKYRRDGADLSVDGTGGWAAGVRSHLTKDHETDCASIVFSKGSNAKTLDGTLDFLNLRVEMYWKFREALDPQLGDDIALPPDPRLFAELTAQRYWIKSRGKEAIICMFDKAKQAVSPDRSDAVVMAWRRRNAWARKMAIKAQSKTLAPPVPAGPNSWMG